MFVAECQSHDSAHVMMATFNGAATCSLRNALSWSTALSSSMALQWGRNMFVAEWDIEQIANDMYDATFNGAATCSLRNVAGNYERTANRAGLQWGRNMFVAE